MDPEIVAAWKTEIVLQLKKINEDRMAISDNNKAPNPSDLLFENLFIRRNRNSTLDVISKGLNCVAENAESLLHEAKILADSEKKARASFLVTTANEEIAKAYILLDICRLDFEKQQTILRRLCKAFYNHIAKYAYYKTIWRSTSAPIPWPRIVDFFKNDLKEWRPSESMDEPDMPHDVYFDRESNLYVDFSDYAQTWVKPIPENPRQEFDIYSKSRKSLDRLISSNQAGLFKVEVLDIFNEVFRTKYINIENFPVHAVHAQSCGRTMRDTGGAGGATVFP
jgi:AbiV family abortive infection protein